MEKTQWLHPEVRIEVLKEFNRLRQRHTTLDGDALLSLARDYVWTLALADSAILRCEIASGSL